MLSQFLWSLYDKVVLFLASLNPATKEKVEALQAKATVLDAERLRLIKEIQDGDEIINGLNRIRTANLAERAKLDAEIAESKAALEKRKADRARLSDADKLELDV